VASLGGAWERMVGTDQERCSIRPMRVCVSAASGWNYRYAGICIMLLLPAGAGSGRLGCYPRPTSDAPGVPFVCCRYADARTIASAILAADLPGGDICTSFLTRYQIDMPVALPVKCRTDASSLTADHPDHTYATVWKYIGSVPNPDFMQAFLDRINSATRRSRGGRKQFLHDRWDGSTPTSYALPSLRVTAITF
jgi:hypothetical protein